MDDLISRQAAIDALNEQIEYCNKALGSFDISPKDEYAVKVEKASLEAYKEQLENLPSAQPENRMERDVISRQVAIKAFKDFLTIHDTRGVEYLCPAVTMDGVNKILSDLPSVQPERLTDDDFETIRIHLNAYKEKLCNQQRWKEAAEYQRIIDRFMAFASAQPERKTGKWLPDNRPGGGFWVCSCCKFPSEAFAANVLYKFCPNCGAYMGGSEGV